VQSDSLENRLVSLERQMETLRGLPDQVSSLESQFLQFRTETRGELSALRLEVGTLGQDLRHEIAVVRETLHALRQDMHDMRDELRQEIRAGDEDTRRYMRVLHEEVLSRIALLGERWNNRFE
jgi:chromosome segregation ATPase